MVHVYVASAFSKDNKGGNKAGVVFDRPNLTAEQKMWIAKELGYSETAFVSRSDVADFRLEYFTPTEEVPLCGHATIAAFSVLWHLGKLDKEEYTFEAKAGILRIRVSEDGMIFMEQNLPEYLDVLNIGEAALCFNTECSKHDLPIQIVSTGLRDILMPVESEETLAAMVPDFQAMTELSREKDVVGMHAFTLLENSDVTAVCRNFAPLYGIDEESATGTSNCALACYLFKYYKKQPQYVFEQGYNLGDASRIVVELQYNGEQIESVFVGGYGYLVCEKMMEEEIVRCRWCNMKNPLYVEYHDKEWGVPEYDDGALFELLVLESFQAGLSWECVLNKRAHFREAFDGFDLETVCGYGEEKIADLLQNKNLIRNRLKMNAAVNNARIFREIQKEYGTFAKYLWHFTDGKIIYEFEKTSSELSDQVSKDLKKRGMKFVGTTIIYSYLQAAGIINSHEEGCFLYKGKTI